MNRRPPRRPGLGPEGWRVLAVLIVFALIAGGLEIALRVLAVHDGAPWWIWLLR